MIEAGPLGTQLPLFCKNGRCIAAYLISLFQQIYHENLR